MSRLIGICGPSGSGKSTICEYFSIRGISHLSMDSFFKTKEQNKTGDWDNPNALNLGEFIDTLGSIKYKKTDYIFIPEYDRKNKTRTGTKLFRITPDVLVEGFLLFNTIYHSLDKKIFLDLPKEIQKERRRKRYESLGMEFDENYFENVVYPAFEQYILPYKRYAEYVIDASKDFDLVVKKVADIINESKS
ncbi:MAG: AAA family ATPase [Candidatus Aenigmarchaeota archaeon]|nr:AAA family ATPase [Candidatus Aenigmarchaeota archaeon]